MPSLAIEPPVPLEHLCTFRIDFVDTHVQRTPLGTRVTYVIGGGRCEGERVHGEFLPGGGDWVLLGADRIARLDVRALLRTDNGALVSITNTGRARPRRRGDAAAPRRAS